MSVDDLVYGFHARLKELIEQQPEAFDRLVQFEPENGRYDDPVLLGRRAADLLFAPAIWAEAVGPLYDTAQVTELLGVSRQAIAQRVSANTLLGLTGRRSRMYPTWQFVHGSPVTLNELVPRLLGAWHEIEPDVDPLTIAAWANAASEYLDERRPADAVEAFDDQVVWAAEATAHQRTR